MKVTETELNLAYTKVNEYKNNHIDNKLPETIEIDIERNPLTDDCYFDEDSEFVTPFKLIFKFDKNMGSKGSYYLVTENIEIIEEPEENDNI